MSSGKTPFQPKPSDFFPEILSPYDVRLSPAPVPVPGIFDAPLVRLCVNATWVSHLDGLLERLLYPDAWQGTTAEQERAIGEVRKLLALLSITTDTCEDELVKLRQNPTNDCQLQISYDGGTTWQLAFDYSLCRPIPRQPTNQRYTPDGILEVSYDGGATWQEDRASDPRFNSPEFPNPYGDPGDETRCNAAYSALEYFQYVVDKLIADVNAGASITALISVIAGLLVIVLSGGALWPAVIALGAAAVGAGGAALQAAFTTVVWETLRCILYCAASDDGSFDEAAWQRVKQDLRSQLTGVAMEVLVNQVDALGPVGLTNAARVFPDQTGTCEACDCDELWCYTFDFTVDSYGWADLLGYGSIWHAGLGWSGGAQAGVEYTIIDKNVSVPFNLSDVTMQWDLDGENSGRGYPELWSDGVQLRKGGDVIHPTTGNWWGWNQDGGNKIRLLFFANVGLGGYLKSVTLAGNGPNPFGADNCP